MPRPVRPLTGIAALLVFGALLTSDSPRPVLHAQAGPAAAPVVVQASGFAVSSRLADLPDPDLKSDEEIAAAPLKTVPITAFRTERPDAGGSLDPVIQSSVPETPAIPVPSLTFEGISNQDNANIGAGRLLPPDTVGDVGPNHYVQMVNSAFRIWDKAGNPLTPVRKLSDLFAALGSLNPCSTSNDGDPVVLYDELADRWILSQLCAVANPNNHQLIAISHTADPTGAYFLYDFMMPNNKFNDSPKFGVWPDGYYMTDNQFDQARTAFLGAGVFAFDRAKMLVGDPTASYIYFDLALLDPSIGGMLPSDHDGLTPPPIGRPNTFAYFTADEFSDPQGDALRLFDFHADFAHPAASTFTERAQSPLAVAPFDPRSPTGFDDVEQPPPAASSSEGLDAISDRLMHRLQYRNFGSHESLVVTHTVNATPAGGTVTLANHQAGIRYYELRQAFGGGGSFSVHEQATFAPDAHNRWMGSAAVDNDGNLAVGYSVSSTTAFPSIRYAGRLATDAPGGLMQGETTLQAGGFVQRHTASRWSGHSSLNIDPSDDCTFWYTNEYYQADHPDPAVTTEWQTRVGTFSFPACSPASKGTLQGVVTNAATGLPIAGAVVATSTGYHRWTGAAGAYAMAAGPTSYDMIAAAPNYVPATATGVVVVDGGTTIQNFALNPMPIVEAAGSALAAETCSPGTGAIDPGETVTVDLAVRNVGTADTADLVATLQATGGVTSPGAPQSYGVVPINGVPVARSFTFTADAGAMCGGTLTASLHLQDGARDLGTLEYAFTLGALGNGELGGTYGSGNIAVPIPDLNTVEVPVNVPDTGAITDINVRLRLNHTFDGDLLISLVHPDGTVVVLSNKRGGAGDNFGSGANDCSGTFAVFDDAGDAPIALGAAPFVGSFTPEQPLSALSGKRTNGVWKLRISDQAVRDVGTVGCVQLEINRRRFLCCPYAGAPVVHAAPPAIVAAESCSNGGGNAADPDETVTVEFPLQNVGDGPTSNLVATLLPGNGVNAPSGPQSYGALSPVGPPVSRPFTFVASGTCGGTIMAALHLQDGSVDLGTVTFNLTVGGIDSAAATASNPAATTIPAAGTDDAAGSPANPYPSSIDVSGVTGTVTTVAVTLVNLSHTFPDDIDVLLVGPGGQKLILMSDAGGSPDLGNVTLTFDDAAMQSLPDSTLIAPGVYRPTNYGAVDSFPAPAPAAPSSPAPAGTATLTSTFGGINPNGTWSLYVVDDAPADVGSIAAGWSLSLTTAVPLCCDQACALTCPADVVAPADAQTCTAVVSYPAPIVEGSCGVVATAPPSGFAFPIGSTPVTSTATRLSDGRTTACSFDVTVTDVGHPAITGEAVNPPLLWSPDHRMVDVTVSYDISDTCAPVTTSLTVTSNEPINGTGDGDTDPDWAIVDNHHVRLRAERAGGGTGRIYTITITATDALGNSSQRMVTVAVPHDP